MALRLTAVAGRRGTAPSAGSANAQGRVVAARVRDFRLSRAAAGRQAGAIVPPIRCSLLFGPGAAAVHRQEHPGVASFRSD